MIRSLSNRLGFALPVATSQSVAKHSAKKQRRWNALEGERIKIDGPMDFGHRFLDRWLDRLPSGKHTKNYRKSPFLMGKSTIYMAMFNSYVKLPELTSFFVKFEEYPSKNLRRLFQNHYLGEHGPSVRTSRDPSSRKPSIWELTEGTIYWSPDLMVKTRGFRLSLINSIHWHHAMNISHGPLTVKPPGTFSASNVGRWPWHGMQRLDPS